RRQVATVFAGLQVGTLFEQQKVFEVVVWGAPEVRSSLTSLHELLLETPKGKPVRLREVAELRIAPTPTVIHHEALSPRVDVVASYISEVVLAIEPWSARLHMPFITPGAASNEISKKVHEDYDQYKYTFDGWLTTAFIAQSVCDFSRDVLVNQLHVKTAVVMSEDAAWTTPLDARYLECLPKAGVEVLDHIRFNPDTADFTPIFSQIERK